MKENKEFIESIRQSPLLLDSVFTIARNSFHTMISKFRKRMEEAAVQKSKINVHSEILTSIMIGGILMLLNWWCNSDNVPDEKEMIEEVSALLSAFFSAFPTDSR